MKKMFLLLMFLLLSGCGIIEENAIRKEVLANDMNMSPEFRHAIWDKKIMVGMSKDQVRASWGNPCWHCYGTRESSYGDTWEYNIFGTGSNGIGGGTYLFFDRRGKLKSWSKAGGR